MNKEKRKFWTLRYALINIFYFAAFCTVHAYAAVFLLEKGFTNTQIGIALAVANVLSVITQPFIAGIIDRKGKLTNRNVTIFSSMFLLVGAVLLLLVRTEKIVIFIIFVLIYMVQFVYQSFIVAMNFEYQNAGCKINFGLARGLGSAGFAITSALIGSQVEKHGTDILLYATVAFMIGICVLAFFFKKPTSENIEESADEQEICGEKNKETGDSFFAFVKRYPTYTLMLLGITLLFFSHNILNDFLIQIIRNLGGNESHMGYATFTAAILELPVMAIAGMLLKKISAGKLIVFSAFGFAIKALIMLLAVNLAGMFLSQACQAIAYALLIPVSAIYADMVMADRDKVKGQAYINSAITLGGVFSNLMAGKILDDFGVKSMLGTGLAVCTLGAVTVSVSIFLSGKKKV